MRYSSNRFKWRGRITLLAILLISGLVSGCGSVSFQSGAEEFSAESAAESEAQPAAVAEVESEELTAEEVTAEEVTAEEVTAEEVTAEEVTAEEAVQAEGASQEVASAEESQPDVVEAADTSAIPVLSSVSEDFTLVGATGRPQLVYTYADWWSTWQTNKPIVYRLQKKFGEGADFIALDVNDLAARSTRMGLGMRNRSHFVLVDQNGNRLAQWFGPLNEQAMFDQIGERLSELN